MADPTRFWNWIAARYAKQAIGDEAAYQRKIAITQGYFRPDMQLLEIGCGTGTTAITHAPHVAHIRAVDFSANMISIAREKAAAAGVQNVSFEVTSVDDAALAAGPYDMVLALSVLHLVADRDQALADLFRTLKPGGLLVSSTVCIGESLGFMKWIAPLGYAARLLPMVRVFTEADLLASLTGAGFVIDQQWKPDGKKTRALFVVARKP